MKRVQLAVKRLFDVTVSGVLMIVLLPIMAAIAILIRLESSGNAVFKQKRIGKDGKVFEIYKFRTMVNNAEKIGKGLFIENEEDTRITRTGKILRSTSLDELPQLINVLKGEMSIVGPRPPVVYHPYNGYENYPEKYKKRFTMRPGITGLAQVKIRNSGTWEERIKVDIQYIKRFSLGLDMVILIRTAQAMAYRETYTKQGI